MITPEIFGIIGVVLVAFVAVLAFRAYQYAQENYEKLPDRIPIHFGLRGTADSYAKKSKFSVFWPIAGIVVFPLVVVVPLISLPAAKETPLELIELVPVIIGFSIAYLFYAISRGIIDYSLGRAKSIWPYMAAPLIAIFACALATSGISFASLLKEPQLVEAVTCGSVDNALNPVKQSEVFNARGDYVTVLLKWKYLNGNHKIIYKWIMSDGSLAHNGEYTVNFSKIKEERKTWYRLDLSQFRDKPNAPGKWQVKIFLDGKEIKTVEFRLVK